MASPNYLFIVSNFCHIVLLLLISNLPKVISQDSSPAMSQCTSSLLPLIPCTPFVQGTAPSPGQECCSNLKQIYRQEPHCLCLLLTDTNLSSLPINRTLALLLPTLCIQVNANMSSCLGEQVHMPATSPHSQVSLSRNNSTVMASPTFSAPPRLGTMGLGFGRSKANNIKTGYESVVVRIVISILLLPSVFY